MHVAGSIRIPTSQLRRGPIAPKASPFRRRRFGYIVFFVFLAFLCSLFYIWSRIQIVNVGYEINRENLLREELVEQNKKLTLQVATLKSPVRLESLAKNNYQMDLPGKEQVFTLSSLASLPVASLKNESPAKQTEPKSVKVEAKNSKKESSQTISENNSSSKNPLNNTTKKNVPKKTQAKKLEPQAPQVASLIGNPKELR